MTLPVGTTMVSPDSKSESPLSYPSALQAFIVEEADEYVLISEK